MTRQEFQMRQSHAGASWLLHAVLFERYSCYGLYVVQSLNVAQ